MKRNPKQEGSNLFDCIPQVGLCPNNCNQCYFNRPGAFYVPIDQAHFPTVEEVGDGIVRVNCGNDSNNDRDYVIASTAQYKHRFFNTSEPDFDFPAPVVFTANPEEEKPAADPYHLALPDNLMFVRLRTSATNLDKVGCAAYEWTAYGVPIVLTFMAYYDHEPQVEPELLKDVGGPCYEWKVRHINSYWCPTPAFMRFALASVRRHAEPCQRLVSMCGSLNGPWCRDCLNCETHYWQTVKRMAGE
jgi:hypothetical protein